MAKKKPSGPKSEGRTSFMFPRLHQVVFDVVSDQIPSAWFNQNSSTGGSTHEYSTNVMGTFRCTNDGCSKHGWASKKVAILIRGYSKNGYNAVVFNQRCKACNRLGILTLDKDSYVERVAYRLKRWAGVSVETPPYKAKSGRPHESSLCEGCKMGYCSFGREG